MSTQTNPDLKPYTYVIVNVANGMWYWGVRKPHRWPDDGYMGTSGYVNVDIEKYGRENFKKTILEFFDTYEEARDAEKDLIRPDLNDQRCYNKSCGGKFAAGEKHPMYGRTHTEEAKQKISKTQIGKKCSLETRQKLREAHKNMPEDRKRNRRQKISEKRKIQKPPMLGKKHSEQTREKMSQTHLGKISSLKGKPLSAEHRIKISNRLKGRIPEKKYICIHCNKGPMTKSMYNRWHGEQCSSLRN